MKLLSSIPILNDTDYILSIGDHTFPANTTIADAGETFVCEVKTYLDETNQSEDLYLVFGVEEGTSVDVTTIGTAPLSEEVVVASKNHVIPVLSGNEGILFGGHPRPKPPRASE